MSTNIVDVGTPTEDFKDWTTTVVRFHGFAELPTTRNEGVDSPEFSCFGHQWRLGIYPGGATNSPEGYVAVGLRNRSNSSIKIQYGFSVRDADGREVVYYKPDTDKFAEVGSGRNTWSITNFAKRTKLMKSSVNGSLVIEVRMKPTSTDKSITQFIPTNPINKNILNLYTAAEETADVLFEVGGQQQSTDTNKKNKTTTNFYAHRLILLNSASTLYEMIGESDEGGGITTISITDVKPEIFRHMIYYTYGGKLSEEILKNNAKDIINACDKFGVVHLKLEAEATYVESTEITINNMMDNLLYADSKNLALLKEAVMDYIVTNKRDILGKVSFNDFPGHLVTDLLAAVARGHPSENENDNEDKESIKYNEMRVGTLRKMLDEKGLAVDGSRESMIALLKENA